MQQLMLIVEGSKGIMALLCLQVQLCCGVCGAAKSTCFFTANTSRKMFGRALHPQPQLPCLPVFQSICLQLLEHICSFIAMHALADSNASY